MAFFIHFSLLDCPKPTIAGYFPKPGSGKKENKILKGVTILQFMKPFKYMYSIAKVSLNLQIFSTFWTKSLNYQTWKCDRTQNTQMFASNIRRHQITLSKQNMNSNKELMWILCGRHDLLSTGFYHRCGSKKEGGKNPKVFISRLRPLFMHLNLLLCAVVLSRYY